VPGGFVYEDELVAASHSMIMEGEKEAYLGLLFTEPKRHAPGLADLTDEEAARMGLLASSLSRVLKDELGAEHVYLFVLGHHIPHLHIWLVPRYPGTPQEYWGLRVDEWPEAPKGDKGAIAALCDRIRVRLGSDELGRA
jgi:diadenosine tetraphosphate (Ap4A) HIT family hydrolase